jgi:hypothetical protein
VDRIASLSSRRRAAIGLGLVAALAGACTDGGSTTTVGSSDSAGASGGTVSAATISQPPIPTRIPGAQPSERVDLAFPTFPNPTEITNPLFPVSDQASVLLLGHVDGEPFRTEVTLLPYTRIIEWEGQRVETLVSQYNAFLGGSIEEVAYDYYAQADDGSVWYFGEDVFDFRDGAMISTEGTWLAGRDGPAAMIMPADPRVGDVYRPENAPGFVFEEVTVRSTDRTLGGPLGPIQGGMLVDELHADGKTEQKIFAPGYGEFYTAGGGDVEALALAVPTDAATEPLPAELTTMSNAAMDLYDAGEAGDWKASATSLDDLSRAWAAYRAGEVPGLIEPLVVGALRALGAAVASRESRATQDAAIAVSRLALDLQLRYRPVVEIDLARLDLWAAQMVSDAAANDGLAVSADSFAMDYVRDRLLRALDERRLRRLNVELGAIQVAVIDRIVAEAGAAAQRLRDEISSFRPG